MFLGRLLNSPDCELMNMVCLSICLSLHISTLDMAFVIWQCTALFLHCFQVLHQFVCNNCYIVGNGAQFQKWCSFEDEWVHYVIMSISENRAILNWFQMHSAGVNGCCVFPYQNSLSLNLWGGGSCPVFQVSLHTISASLEITFPSTCLSVTHITGLLAGYTHVPRTKSRTSMSLFSNLVNYIVIIIVIAH